MTLQEFKQTDWFKERPNIIKRAIELIPPIQLYKFKDSGKQCEIYSYHEPETGKLKDVTVSVIKTGIGGPLSGTGLELIDKDIEVFGVKLNRLEPWIE